MLRAIGFKFRDHMNLFPKDEIFYTLFEKQAEKLSEASKLLTKILKEPQKIEELSLRMKKNRGSG